MTDRVVLFIDYQNVYRRARELYCNHDVDPHWMGQISPGKLGRLLVDRSRFPRELYEVRVYRGLPSSSKDPKSYAAARAQNAEWEMDPLVKVISRPLRYPYGWPNSHVVGSRPQEKGIDVSLAIDFAAFGVERSFDVGILFSVDTDLIPALEFVMKDQARGRAEVAAWSSEDADNYNRRLSCGRNKPWCHWLTQGDFDAVRDDTDYTK